MSYIAVLNYDSKSDSCYVVTIDEKNYNIEKVVGIIKLSDLGKVTLHSGCKPLNYSVDRNTSVKQDCGSFSRFVNDGAGVCIVLAELVSQSGRTLGYRLAHSSGQIFNLKTADIVDKEALLRRPYLQNGIVRNNTVNCYPLHKFKEITIVKSANKPIRKPEVDKGSTGAKKKKAVQMVNPLDKFTQEQKNEFKFAQNKGIDIKFMFNPDLSPEQMRVLWVSKSKGVLSEYIARPEYSVDVMKFYADRLYSKKIIQDCSLMMHKPDLKVDQLSELYLCVCDGVDYSDLLDKPASDIFVERLKRSEEIWGSKSDKLNEEDVFFNAMNEIAKLKGLC